MAKAALVAQPPNVYPALLNTNVAAVLRLVATAAVCVVVVIVPPLALKVTVVLQMAYKVALLANG